MKKLCTEHIAKIRKAMRLQRNATTRGTKLKEEKRKPSCPATSERATPMPSQRKENKTLRSELTQPEETTELTGRIDQNEEEYRDEMANEVRFFMECLNGLKEVFSDDTKNPLETIIPVPNRKIKKKVETGYTYVMDVAGDIRRLKTENQYLKKTLDGLHKYIIGGDETALNELKTPKHMKDSQSIVEVEAHIKEVTQKFHEIKTNAENATEESECLLSTMECLINHVRGLSEGNTEGDISPALDQIKPSVKKGSPANQCLTHAKEIIGVQMEWKREAEYASNLLEQLNDFATNGVKHRQVILKEPVILMAHDSRTDAKKDSKKQTDQSPRSRHVEQLQRNFSNASKVLEKQMDIRRLKTENQYLRKTLDGLHKYIIGGDERALNKFKTPKHMTDNQSIVEVEANVKEVTQKFHETQTETRRLQMENKYLKLILDDLHKSIIVGEAALQMELKPPEDIQNDKLLIELTTNARKIHLKFYELETELDYIHRTMSQLASMIVGNERSMNRIQEKTNKFTATGRQPKRSPAKTFEQREQSSKIDKDIELVTSVWRDLKEKEMDAKNAIKERECLLLALDCLFKHLRDLSEGTTEGDISSTLDQIKSSINKESSVNQGLSHARAILNIDMEWKREAEYASNLLEQLNDFATNDGKDRQVILKEPVIPMAHDSRIDAKTESKKQTDQPPRSRHVEQLQRNFSSASKVLKKQMDAENAVKERECLLLALDCLFKHSQDLSEGTTEGDILSTLDQIKSSINKESPANQGLSHVGAILNIHMEWKREVEYVACLLEELAKVSQSSNNGDNCIILSHPENCGTSWGYKTKDAKNTESSQNKPMKSVQSDKLMRHYDNASFILKQMKQKEDLRIDLGKRMEQVKDLMARCKKLQEENNEIKNDADLLRTRLSEHAGALLTHDNPSIADLSDPNRPTKLSEMYSELYDNQWTDAFANVAEKDPDISENNIIGYLYEMLLDGYRFCEDVRQTQKSSLEDILFYPAGGMKTSQRRQKEEISAIIAKHLSDVAKLSSNVSSAHMAKAFVMDEKTKDKYRKMIKLCGTYIQKCVQLCWLMQVQTPPLYLDLKTIEGQAFNKICYKVYTKKGKKIAFVVWPALFLHENGPLLSKGVAQCQ